MDRTQQVLLKLKPETKALGFSKKELMGIAAKIADNLTSAEDASDEDVNAEIDTQIKAVLPYLSFGQSMSNRLVNEMKKKMEADDVDDDDDDTKVTKNKTAPKSPQNQKDSEDTPEWAKALIGKIEVQEKELAALKGEKIADSRKSRLEAAVKDTGTFGTRTLKAFSRMKFENDDEFDEYLNEVAEDLKAYNQERANDGLSVMGTPPNFQGGKHEKVEPATDEELKALADLM